MPPSRSNLVLLLAIAVAGLLLLLANRRLPLVRNSLVYARASEHVIAHGYDPRPVVADSKLSYDKPILYAWLSAPFVARLGTHDGLRLTSWLGSVAYLIAVLSFARAFATQLPEGGARGVLWLSAVGPCVLYQFWSAHPDTWFAALVVAAWALTQRLVERPPAWRLLLLGAVIYVAILLKNYGLVLLISCPLALAVQARAIRRSSPAFGRLVVTAVAVFGTLGALVLLARTGHNPFSRLEGEGGGVGQYGQGGLWRSVKGTWVQLGLALLLQLHVALAFAATRRAWGRALAVPLLCFGAVYVAGLMPFPTTFYNMRYFVPLFPLLALVLVRGAAGLAPAARGALWAGHAAIAVALILTFNVEPIHRLAEPALPQLEVDWIGTPLSLLDNLRMTIHRQQAAVLANIDAQVPPGATLYMMDVVYYGDAQQGVYERAGLIRPDIATRYVSRRSFTPAEPLFYAWSFVPRPPPLERWGRVTDLGRFLYRVEREAPGG